MRRPTEKHFLTLGKISDHLTNIVGYHKKSIRMDVILVDLVASDSNIAVVDGDNDETNHSLSSLVSIDNSTVHALEGRNETPTKEDLPKEIHVTEDPKHPLGRRGSTKQLSIIACSSPEIKALVQPIPPSIQYRHQRSVSTLSVYPDIDDGERDEFTDSSQNAHAATTTKASNRKGYPALISPENVRVSINSSLTMSDHGRLSIEYRDQESCRSDGRFVYDDVSSPLSPNSLLSDKATDELARRLQQTGLSSRSLPCTGPQKPVRKRPSMHRRVSYNNLPNMSEILCHPEFQSENES